MVGLRQDGVQEQRAGKKRRQDGERRQRRVLHVDDERRHNSGDPRASGDPAEAELSDDGRVKLYGPHVLGLQGGVGEGAGQDAEYKIYRRQNLREG